MRSNGLQTLGLCRRAGKLSMGHDLCKAAIRRNTACLCLLCADVSERLRKEFTFLCGEYAVPLVPLDCTIAELSRIIGYRAGVVTVDDAGFAGSLAGALKQNTSAEVKDL